MSLWIDRKYLGIVSNQLRNFKWIDSDKAKCSCPICGDSTTDDRKTRGYFITKSDQRGPRVILYCHKCARGYSFEKVLETVAPYLLEEYRMELFKEKGSSKKKKEDVIPVARAPAIRKTVAKMPAVVVTELSDFHPATIYLLSRQIPQRKMNEFYWTENFAELVNFLAPGKYPKLQKESRLCLLMKDRESKVFGIIGRTLEESEDNLRYITIKFDDDALKLYGLHAHRRELPTFLTEGAVDSLFLPNALAMCGSAVSIIELKKEIEPANTILCMDNEPRNPAVVRQMTHFAQEGFRVCVWSGVNTKRKDINNMITSGVSNREILSFISSHTYTSLPAIAAINTWKRC